MKQYLYKIIVFIIATILIYEFTIGKQINKYTDKLNTISSKEGRKESVTKLREEIKKGVKKERYLSKEDAKLINQFLKKIQRELSEANN
jgi:polyribonucleotide nucleotidyltransferase|tara:strand:+ start:187 stop:453 length:267 start_codon:yes stop_codon:yes gene_type:complete